MSQIFDADAWKGAEGSRAAGRDGKWPRNRYERGGHPVGIMEFPTLKEPCCSPCTGAHCGPNK